MNRRDRFALLGVVLLILIAGFLWLAPAGFSQAPAATLVTISGETVDLKELRGRPVLVTFWATTCPGCLKEIPHLVDMYEKFHGRGLAIYGVAMAYDPPNRVVEFAHARDLPYPIALDIDGQVAKAFGNVKLTPTTFLIAPDGRIVMNKTGQIDRNYVQQQIQTMLSGRTTG